MKNGKRPNKKQKITMMKAGVHPNKWLVVKNLSDELHVVHRETDRIRVIPNE